MSEALVLDSISENKILTEWPEPTAAEQAEIDECESPDKPKIQTLPCTNDAIIIGMLATSPKLMAAVAKTLKPEHFINEYHAIIYKGLLKSWELAKALPPAHQLLTEINAKYSNAEKQKEIKKALRAAYLAGEGKPTAYYEKFIPQWCEGQHIRVAINKIIEKSKESGTLTLAETRKILAEIPSAPAGRERRGYTISELLKLPPMKWLIKGIMHLNTMALLFGNFETGKSFIAIDIGLCVATGKAWLGKYNTTKSPVCYIAAEGEAGIAKRVWAWCKCNNIDPASLDNFVTIPFNFNMLEEAETTEAVRIAEATLKAKPSLIILDTLAKNWTGDENSTKDMSTFVRTIEAMGRSIGATVLTIHHAGKDASRGSRGSNSLPAGIDTMIQTEGSVATGVTVHCAKQKNVPHFKSFMLKAVHVDTTEIDPTDEYGSVVLEHAGEVSQVSTDQNEAKLLAEIPELNGQEVTEANAAVQTKLADKLKWSIGKVSQEMAKLTMASKVSYRKAGKNNNTPMLYWRERLFANQ